MDEQTYIYILGGIVFIYKLVLALFFTYIFTLAVKKLQDKNILKKRDKPLR